MEIKTRTDVLSLRVWVMYWIWSEGVRKLPWCSKTSHVRAFKICSRRKSTKTSYFRTCIGNKLPRTDRFKSDGWEEPVDNKVDFLGQVRRTEILQQLFLAAQTVDQHTKSQPAPRKRCFSAQILKLTHWIKGKENTHCSCSIHLLKCFWCFLWSCWISLA